MRPRTLGARFLLILVLGAVLPLALVGAWLSRSAERTGTALLREQLAGAAGQIAATADRQWAVRMGELQLLANNTVARKLLAGEQLTGTDSAYLAELARNVATAVPSFGYMDAAGRERLAFALPRTPRVALERSDPSAGELALRVIRVRVPVNQEGGARLGTLVASVQLSSVISPDVRQALVPGATMTVADSSAVLWSSAPDVDDPATLAPEGWEVAERRAGLAPLTLTLAAPTSPYVKPFERAARLGLGILLGVAVVALVLSVMLTSRVTRSLARVSDAAGAVAAGNLDLQAIPEGDDEVGRLAASFNTMTESLRRTLAELSQQRALAAVGEFAASLSHDVRNSLTAIRVDLQHALRHLPEEDPGAALAGRALDSVRRLDATVTSALRVARSGQFAMTTVGLAGVLGRAIASAAPSFAERGALLDPPSGHDDVAVSGDAPALEQLFLNLLLNAAEALQPGGEAHVTIETSAAEVLVTIRDTGAGVAAHDAGFVGRPLHTTKPTGTGLGLPIARRIAVAHGGDVQLASACDVGTTVVVRLPRA
jgi:signal transduction histidine kinase